MRSRADNGRMLSPLKRAKVIRAGKAAFRKRASGAAGMNEIAAGASPWSCLTT
jgi:hypothetical protein